MEKYEAYDRVTSAIVDLNGAIDELSGTGFINEQKALMSVLDDLKSSVPRLLEEAQEEEQRERDEFERMFWREVL